MPAWTWSARKVEKKLFISAEECKCVLDAMQCMLFIPDGVLLKITTMEFPALYYLPMVTYIVVRHNLLLGPFLRVFVVRITYGIRI